MSEELIGRLRGHVNRVESMSWAWIIDDEHDFQWIRIRDRLGHVFQDDDGSWIGEVPHTAGYTQHRANEQIRARLWCRRSSSV